MSDRTSFADRLYAALPTVYRVRDAEEGREGVLREYLGACGDLLDALRETLIQRHADIFPDSDDGEQPCQDWVLPYLADLVAVRLVSPDAEGRRQEVNSAIGWRQRKGTRRVAEDVAEKVGQLETELIEGWQKVAVTARVDAVKLPARTYGVEPPAESLDDLTWKTGAGIAARHPTLIAGTVDLRCRAGAVRVTDTDDLPTVQGARQTKFADEDTPVWWRQASLHGAPCRPGSYDDPSRRTADARTPAWDRGHAHPRRLLLYVPLPAGLCDRYKAELQGTVVHIDDVLGSDPPEWLSVVSVDDADLTIRVTDPSKAPVWIEGDIPPRTNGDVVLKDVVLDGALSVDAGTISLTRCALESVELTNSADDEALSATDSLLGSLDAADAHAVLVYSTVLGEAVCGRVSASDSVFAQAVSNNGGSVIEGCIRYSRVAADQDTTAVQLHRTTSAEVVFFSTDFGEPGCGVLHPASDQAALGAAEDGGEPGAHHHLGHVLRARAALDKLAHYLPLDITPVLIPDAALLEAPTSS